MFNPFFLFRSGCTPTSEKQPNVKEFYKEDGTPNKPKVFVASQGHIIACTTDQHMQVADMPIEEYLRKVIREARVFGDQIFPKYGPGGEIGWFPCGTANIVLRWNEHREIIDLLRKTSEEGKKGEEMKNDFWKGWFGRLFKTSDHGWWWTPPMQGTQAMLFQEEVCKFVREKLVFKNIKVDVRTYID